MPPRVALEKGDTILLFQSFLFTSLENVSTSPPCHHHSLLKSFSHSIPSVLVSPNIRFGGTPPSPICHQVLASVLTKKSHWLVSPLLSLVVSHSGEDLRRIPTSQLHLPIHTRTRAYIHSTLPAHDLVTLSQIVAFITSTPMVLTVHVPTNLLMLDSESLLMLMGFSRLKRVQTLFPTKIPPMMLGPYGPHLPLGVNTHNPQLLLSSPVQLHWLALSISTRHKHNLILLLHAFRGQESLPSTYNLFATTISPCLLQGGFQKWEGKYLRKSFEFCGRRYYANPVLYYGDFRSL